MSLTEQKVSLPCRYFEMPTRTGGTMLPCINSTQKMTELHIAAIKGDVTAIASLLKQGCDPDQPMEFQWTALHLAATYGQLGAVKALIDGHCDVNVPNEEDLTPLHLAAAKGHSDIAKLLLDHAAEAGARTRTGACAHDCAVMNGQGDAAAIIPQKYQPDAEFDDENSPFFYKRRKFDVGSLPTRSGSSAPLAAQGVATAAATSSEPALCEEAWLRRHPKATWASEKRTFKADEKTRATSQSFSDWYGEKCACTAATTADDTTATVAIKKEKAGKKEKKSQGRRC
jgi:ankyrin repeat protein